MEPWIIWLALALLLFIVEMYTNDFSVICLSIGAGAAAIPAGLNASHTTQVLVFAGAALLLFIFIRPLALRLFGKGSKEAATNSRAMIGREVLVIEDIDAQQGTGLIKLDGEVWSAVNERPERIVAGSYVVITDIHSIILTVSNQ